MVGYQVRDHHAASAVHLKELRVRIVEVKEPCIGKDVYQTAEDVVQGL